MKWQSQHASPGTPSREDGRQVILWRHFIGPRAPSAQPRQDVQAENQRAAHISPRMVDNAAHLLDSLRRHG